MANRNNNNKKGVWASLLGEATPAKASGLTFSLSASVSVAISFFFLLIVAMSGVKEGYETQDWYLYASFLISPVTFALVAWYIFRWSKTSLKAEIKAQICPARYFIVAIILQCGLFCLSQLNGIFLDWLTKFGYEDTPIHLPSMDGLGLWAR